MEDADDEALLLLIAILRQNLEATVVLLRAGENNPVLKEELAGLRKYIQSIADSFKEK